jgi:hypothetical protein
MRTPILGPGTFSAPSGSTHRETIVGTFKNGEASLSLALGTPVVLSFNGTDDGLAVVLPSTAAGVSAAKSNFEAGVVVSPNGIASGQIGDVQTWGLCLNARITAATRSATSAAWVSYASQDTGVLLAIETVGNGFSIVGSTVTQQYLAYAILAQSFSSSTTQASSLSQPYVTAKVFLRML